MNIKDIEKLIKILKESDVNEITIEEEGVKIQLKRDILYKRNIEVSNSCNNSDPGKAVSEKIDIPTVETKFIRAKMPGTFYRAPSPDSPVYVKEGSIVNEDTVVCIIEAMKIFNEIKAGISGKIKKILINDGESVEYDQAIFEIENN
jgi:acetyl-CoA carboxylase biotin carboxyl carrier protein